MIEEIYEILFQFGGGKGGEPGNVAVRFLLPTFFWIILAWIAYREWKTDRQRKDFYVGIAAFIGMARELMMFIAEYGSWRGRISFDLMYNYYPPFEHAATMFSCIFIGAAFLRYLQVSERFVKSYLVTSSVITGLLYIVTASAWQNFLREHPNTSFGLFWGDMAFRIAASLFMGAVVAALLNLSQQGRFIPRALIIGFTFLFLDEFLMIFNIASRERYVQYFAPLRHNLHIWAIPLFIAFYWTDLRRRMSAAEQIISNTFSLSPGMLCVFDKKGVIQIASPAARQIVGMEPDELSGQDIHSFCVPLSDSDRISSGKANGTFEQQCTLPDGSARWLSWNVHHSADDGLNYAVISDWTAQKTAEDRLSEALKQSEMERAKTDAVIAAIGDGLSIQDRNFRIIYQNQQYKDLLGEHIGELCYEAYAKQGRICPDCPVLKSFRDGRIHTVERQFTIGESQKLFEITVSPLMDSTGSITAGIQVVRDITIRRTVENDIAKTQRIESLGVLAGGIAHDFNNILTAIMGNISLAQMKTDQQGPAAANLREAEKAAVRAKDLVQQILTFAKGGGPVKKIMQLEQVVRDAGSMALRGSRSTCSFVIRDSLLPAEIDRAQISQAVANIISNADQAMPNGGTITVSCSNVLPKDNLPSSLAADRKYILITISDTGVGIPRESLKRVFDPYFTTKQKGAGLGLSAAHSIVTKHGGQILVDSEPGAGSTFSIYLPAAVETPAKNADTVDTHPVTSGRVMIMDDEEAVREVAGEILKSAGCSIAFARDGQEAVDMFRQALADGEPFDSVVLDLTIPGGMGGRQAMEILVEIDPEIKAIVSSGYSNDAVMSDYQAYGFCGMVAKPYLPEDLCSAVFSAIRNRRTGNGPQ